MKKIFASLAVCALISMSAAPVFAAWQNRAPVMEYCVIGTGINGPRLELRATSCVPFLGKSCLPQSCIRPFEPVNED